MSKKQTLLTVDPGTTNTGWAKFYDKPGGWELIKSGVSVAPARLSDVEKIQFQRKKVASLILARPRVTSMWIEDYSAFGPKAKSKEQLLLQGALLTLPESLISGGQTTLECPVSRVTAAVWKKWMKETGKEVLQYLSDNYETYWDFLPWGAKKVTSHELDAIGIGLYVLSTQEYCHPIG